MHHVIIGNGIAGISAVEALRRLDPDADITLIGDEGGLPYCRPMIAMVLEGSIAPDRLSIRASGYYAELGIRTVFGDRIHRIDLHNREVRFDDDRRLPFDRLLIATGADPRPIKSHGQHLDGIYFMRTAGHVQSMLDRLPRVRQALVLGGGLVGFKAAYGLLRRGFRVTMLIRSGYPLSLQVDETAGRMILQELLDHGLDVRVGSEAVAFEGDDAVREAVISDGTRISCDMVVIGKGVLPALSFVPREEIQVDLGILVDSHFQTSAPGVFAAGDVAELVDVARGTRWVNAIWPEAAVQGRIAGLNMAGRRVKYPGSLGRNVIRIFGMDILTAGVVAPPQDAGFEVFSALDRRRLEYRRLVMKDGYLVGCTLVNAIEQGGVMVSLIHNRVPVTVPPRKLLSPRFNIKSIMDHTALRTQPE
ncbi:MAG: NAD(P)/FAD-dependent oxidoreductase [Desulfobacterales bacterium]